MPAKIFRLPKSWCYFCDGLVCIPKTDEEFIDDEGDFVPDDQEHPIQPLCELCGDDAPDHKAFYILQNVTEAPALNCTDSYYICGRRLRILVRQAQKALEVKK